MFTRFRLEFALAAFFLALIAAVWAWENPGALGVRASQADIDRYAAALEKSGMPEPEVSTLTKQMKVWLAEDDGKPVYMLNVLRFREALRLFPGGPSTGTPAEANHRYESTAIPLLFKWGGYPAYAGTVQGRNLIENREELNNWDRVLLVRYPNRRTVMEIFTHPDFTAIVGDKLAALSVVLTPTTQELLIPDLPWLLAAILLPLWLAIGWYRAARSNTSGAQQ